MFVFVSECIVAACCGTSSAADLACGRYGAAASPRVNATAKYARLRRLRPIYVPTINILRAAATSHFSNLTPLVCFQLGPNQAVD
jgi:hypothetical protein